ncbi:hypothetical protein [Xanthomonas vasicola]|uniref:hypothetical protein n=1 Tax=Xanthomonas vasicola TaxID=56459 RepID=UPI0015CD6860|nr:hypothetical protein [Xanthomonas vasicola]MBV6745415.1 hypothetical protein [Xanthomonas vasicola pv. vasculorum NCPPB 890]MDO6946281.1 hypothetical protein [Xanthomonas vasicola]
MAALRAAIFFGALSLSMHDLGAVMPRAPDVGSEIEACRLVCRRRCRWSHVDTARVLAATIEPASSAHYLHAPDF